MITHDCHGHCPACYQSGKDSILADPLILGNRIASTLYLELKEDIKKAVQKHSQRRFIYQKDPEYHICILCKKSRHSIDTTSGICWDCAIKQDFGELIG